MAATLEGKILKINGVKTFPIGIYSVALNHIVENDLTSIAKNKDFTFVSGSGVYRDSYISTFESNNLNYVIGANVTGIAPTASAPWKISGTNAFPGSFLASPKCIGFIQVDEPPTSTHTNVKAIYDAMKARSPSSLVIMNHWENLTTWLDCGDIMTVDSYPVCRYKKCVNGICTYVEGLGTDAKTPNNTGACAEGSGCSTTNPGIKHADRMDAIYSFSQLLDQNYFKGTDINSVSKPVWLVVQAYGKSYNKWLKTTATELRAMIYDGICMDFKGIVLYGYKSYGGTTDVSGLVHDAAQHAAAIKYAQEIKSFNNWLIAPTVTYRHDNHITNQIVFEASKLFTKTVLYKSRTNFDWILKKLNNTYYLVVVNKDVRAVNDIQIDMSGAGVGTAPMKTIGNHTAGSGRTGRIIPMANGIFRDTFDGLAVHIYQIGTGEAIPPPDPTLGSITLSGCDQPIKEGQTCQMTATCKDSAGAAIACPALSWGVSPADKATVTQTGMVTGTGAGAAAIAAVSGSISATRPVIITTARGSVNISSNPPGASIWINGTDTGQITPAIIPNVIEGPITITLKKTGFHDASGTATVTAGQTITAQQITMESIAINGSINITTVPPGAYIIIDDVPTKQVTPNIISLPPGVHRIKVVLEGYDVVMDPITLYEGQQIIKLYTLTKNGGGGVLAKLAVPLSVGFGLLWTMKGK